MIQIILALLLLTLLGLIYLSRGNPGKYQVPIGVVVALAVLALVAKFTLFNASERHTTKRYAASVGFTLGQQVARIDPKRLLVIHYPDYDPDLRGRAKAELEGFRKGLKNDGVELVFYEPLAPANLTDADEIAFWYGEKRWRREFIEWLPKQGRFDALVSFVGIPNFQARRFVETLPPIYMRYSGKISIDKLSIVEAGKLVGYIHLRHDLKSGHQLKPGSNLKQVFNTRYRWTEIKQLPPDSE